MSIEANKQLERRYFEDAPYNPDLCDEIFAATFQFHAILKLRWNDHFFGETLQPNIM